MIVVRRAGLWIMTLNLSVVLPYLATGGSPHANAVVPLAFDAPAASSAQSPSASRLLDPNPAARACAARELGARGVDAIGTVPGLVALLADDTVVSMPECAETRADHGGFEQADEVIDCPTSPAREASRSLARIGASAVQPLIAALGDVRATMRRYAIIALGLIDDGTLARSVTAPLTATVGDSDWQVRRSAVWALAAHGDSAAFVPVSGRLKDDSPRVREMAARGLGRMED